MDYRLNLMLKGPELPATYRNYIQGCIYNILQQDPLTSRIHNEIFSLFTFQLTDQPTDNPEDSEIYNFSLRVSSFYRKVLDLIQKQADTGSLKLGKDIFQITNIIREPLTRGADFYVDSLLVIGKDKKMMVAWEKDYNTAVEMAIRNRWKYAYRTELPRTLFGFTEKPKVQKNYYQNRTLATHSGPISILSTPEVIQFVQNVGLGHKTSCGFGMVI